MDGEIGDVDGVSGTALRTGEGLYQVLRAAIVSLKFAPGQLLSENELSGLLRASRTPIRDALKRLEREALIVISPRRKTMVAPLNLVAYQQSVFAREALESAAAGEAARLGMPPGQTPLTANVAELEKALKRGDFAGFDAIDRDFHDTVMNLAHLGPVIAIVEGIRGLADRMRNAHLAVLQGYDRSDVVRQHRAIAVAIEAGDVDAARVAMSAHVLAVFSRIVLLARERPDFFGEARKEDLDRLDAYARAARSGRAAR